MQNTLVKLHDYWDEQNIYHTPSNEQELQKVRGRLNLTLPTDFQTYFLSLNGMARNYPNWPDKNGFIFLPLEKIVTCEQYFYPTESISGIFLFADYLHESWWYGCKPQDAENYMIGIVPHESVFTPLTSSLEEFIHLYMSDSEILYRRGI